MNIDTMQIADALAAAFPRHHSAFELDDRDGHAARFHVGDGSVAFYVHRDGEYYAIHTGERIAVYELDAPTSVEHAVAQARELIEKLEANDADK